MAHSRLIRKVAVLGSGIMGSRIACHFANIGVQVLLLDVQPKSLTASEEKKGLTLESPLVRNWIVNESLEAAVKSSPAALYKKSFISRIKTGNFTDNLKEIANCDWILEAVVENLKIKQEVFTNVEQYRKPGTIISSNTSGIPLSEMASGRTDDFRRHFCGTHFFNPPRYLRLLEIIPGPETLPEVIDFISYYGDLFLGKTTVFCKDTPAFIANRIGVFGILSLFHLVEKMKLRIEDVDRLTGPVIGRPKSATFRTCDVVGLDTLVHVAAGLESVLMNSSEKEVFKLPAYITAMIDNKWLGDKTGQGFYKKEKNATGKSEILALDLSTLTYNAQQKTKFASLDQVKAIEDTGERIKLLVASKDQAGDFYRKIFFLLFEYVSSKIPEISDEIYLVDQAMEAGFGWEFGPFETWDILGVELISEAMEASGIHPSEWVIKMIRNGVKSFYKTEDGIRYAYDPITEKYVKIKGQDELITLKTFRGTKTVWSNSGCSVIDIGDGILCCEFKTKMNAIGGEIVEGVHRAIELAENNFRGVVIGNEGANFSAGANLAMILMYAVEQEWEEIDMAVRVFQQMNMRIRYSAIPVIAAPFGLTLGGGCEMVLHADQVQAHAETYIGLVEFGVGLIPGGGGSKEFALRLADSLREGDIEINVLREKFLTIGQARVSTSALEAFDLGILRQGHDEITLNRSRLIADAKRAAITLSESGYSQPVPRKNIKVLGKSGLGIIYAGANSMRAGHYISEHDQLISNKLGYVLCGGDLSQPGLVSEQYLLDLEREAFLSLCGERKTLERIQSILTTGKPLRN